MKGTNVFAIIIITIVLTGCAQPQEQPEPLLENSGFEDGWHLATTYWTPEQ